MISQLEVVNDSNKKKVGDVSIWRNESKKGLPYLSGIISRTDGSKFRIAHFDAKKNAKEEAEDWDEEVSEDGF